MDAAARREYIVRRLKSETEPVSAASLAAALSVSRQIIVGDVALLRASGEKIISTPRGYVLGGSSERTYSVVCVHGAADTEKELNIMVDNGCTVLTVEVEHPVYGLLTGQLQIANRHDVKQFMEKMSSGDASPLSMLTGGVHLHTLSCPDEACFERTRTQLAEAGLLFD